jgi:hypothetical protein
MVSDHRIDVEFSAKFTMPLNQSGGNLRQCTWSFDELCSFAASHTIWLRT